ncbi:hypothetical protein Tco_0055920 [Tanacetum coccineum]
MYPLPNAPIYPNQAPSGLFADYTGSITPFVRWIEDNPLPDRLKMPSHVGSYDGKGDPDNFLHLFEGAIHMQKWACPWPIICSPLRLMILPEYGGIVKRQCITSSRRKEKVLELSLLDHGYDTNQCRELRYQIEEAVKLGRLAHLLEKVKKGKATVSNTQLEE